MSDKKIIKTWEELSKCTSETHMLKIDVEGCNGWIRCFTGAKV
jgi:hypothetical protein